MLADKIIRPKNWKFHNIKHQYINFYYINCQQHQLPYKNINFDNVNFLKSLHKGYFRAFETVGIFSTLWDVHFKLSRSRLSIETTSRQIETPKASFKVKSWCFCSRCFKNWYYRNHTNGATRNKIPYFDQSVIKAIVLYFAKFILFDNFFLHLFYYFIESSFEKY